MYWEEDQKTKSYEVPGNVLEVFFKIDCKTLPVDHNFYLSQAILAELPWIKEEPLASIQHVHIAEEANGWFRAQDVDGAMLHLSKRAKITVRIPKDKLDDLNAVLGKKLDVNGHALTLTSIIKNKKLRASTTINSHFIVTESEDDEAFISMCAKEINALGVNVKKMLSGKVRKLKYKDKCLITRSLMLADLSKEDSILLQQKGIGKHQFMGCGVFIPHKGIEAVNAGEENE